MKIGIDFGTTRIVVARADRGNYPVEAYESPEGARDWVPALVAVRDGELRYGWGAWAVADQPGWTLIRSLKRLLDHAGPSTQVDVGGARFALLPMLAELARAARPAANEAVSAVIGVPAHANTNQRYLTAEAFRLAGYEVLGLMNEPTAAGLEYSHGMTDRKAGGEILLVYDLGGGTFDTSLVRMDGGQHEVMATESISTLGGDDFDHAMAEMALSGEELDSLNAQEHFVLSEICRLAKESLNPNSRRLILDLDAVRPGWGERTVPVADYYQRCAPLIQETLGAVEQVLLEAGERQPDCIYVAGGASELPLVSRMLRERFGRRVRRSAYTRSATAIGLAIHAESPPWFELRERFTRFFGVWREAGGGTDVVFDPVFNKGTPLPRPGGAPLVRERMYQPQHNIGHFRYLEASALDPTGRPVGDIQLWDEILFPFDPALAGQPLDQVPVRHSGTAREQRIAEVWRCGPDGAVTVELRNESANYRASYLLGRWREQAEPVPVTRRPRRQRRS